MKQSFRLLTLVFALALVGPSHQLASGAADIPVVRVSATLTRTSERTGQLSVTADIEKGFHIYALSQPRPFLATKISAAESSAVRVTGAFTPSRPPKIVRHPTVKVELHEYEGQVMWTAPVEFLSPPDANIVVRGMVFAQACEDGRCLAAETYDFKAALAPPPATHPARAIPQGAEVSMH